MSTVNKTISVKHSIGGVLADATSVVLRDPTAAYGMRVTGTGAVVVAAGTALSHDGTGLYSIVVSGLTPGTAYDYWVEIVYGGATKRQQRAFTAPPAADGLGRYLEVDAAVALAAGLLNVGAFTAATADQQNTALALATLDIDGAQRYQGRKWDPAQTLEFPRLAYEAGGYAIDAYSLADIPPESVFLSRGGVVWDWDAVNDVAVVPPRVLLATVFQANAWLDPVRKAAIDRIYSGLVYSGVGSLTQKFDLEVVLKATGGALQLCRQAADLLKNYGLRSGRML